jgi:hypothetical protein
MTDQHRYSTLALDVHWAAGRPANPELEAHVMECDRCRAYFEQLRALDPTARAPRRPAWHWWSGVSLAAAAVAAMTIGWKLRDNAHVDHLTPYVAPKSAPAVQVLVHRDGRTTVWDGRAAVRPRDALALRVACEGLSRVSVLAPRGSSAGDGWMRVSEGACLEAGILPFTLVVDDQPGDERAAIVFSRAALDEATARAEVERKTRGADVWTVELVFPKSSEVSP